MTDFEGIDTITKMFALEVIQGDDKGVFGGFKGFVVPPSYIFHYQRAALSLTARVTVATANQKEFDKSIPTLTPVCFIASVSSIDDSGVSFFGPAEAKDKAFKRLEAFRTLIDEWHPFMPATLEELEQWGRRNGITVDKW
ncbi:hypothetical protein CMI47_21425 [Candidatus Pacearchaeota archaeon]|nr:hypothetical protein [Candidatus Pacearchaeota archaeon]|tara:strand:+ start:86 stop:505 length:420 start_codon:yes stop_codon:yes gene_type:complete